MPLLAEIDKLSRLVAQHFSAVCRQSACSLHLKTVPTRRIHRGRQATCRPSSASCGRCALTHKIGARAAFASHHSAPISQNSTCTVCSRQSKSRQTRPRGARSLLPPDVPPAVCVLVPFPHPPAPMKTPRCQTTLTSRSGSRASVVEGTPLSRLRRFREQRLRTLKRLVSQPSATALVDSYRAASSSSARKIASHLHPARMALSSLTTSSLTWLLPGRHSSTTCQSLTSSDQLWSRVG